MTLRVTPSEIVAEAESSGRPGLLAKAPEWPRVRLAEVARVVNGAPFDSSFFNRERRGMPLVRIRDVGATAISTWYDGPWDEVHRVRRGDLLIGMDGNFVVDRWRLDEAVLNQRVCRVDVDESKYNKRFLELAAQGYLDAVRAKTSSTTVKHLSSKTVAELPLPSPPLDEQRRIVEILEEHLSSLSAAQNAQRSAAVRCTRFVDASLAAEAAFRDAPRVRISDLLESPLSNGRSVKDRPGGFPVLRLTAITSGRFVLSHQKAGDWDEAEAGRFRVEQGDFLCARGNGSRPLVGRGALVRHLSSPVAFPDTMIRIRPDTRKLDPEFLDVAWSAREVRAQIERVAKTTAGIYKVNQRDLGAVLLPVPGLIDQRAIVTRISNARESLDRVQSQMEGIAKRGNALRRALLQAAFSGQLTAHASDIDRAEELVSA